MPVARRAVPVRGGAEVTLTVDGDTDRLPATTGLAVYRAESLGGTCDAGPGGVGWLVRVALPLHAGWEWEAAP